jgi:hypothetical protein
MFMILLILKKSEHCQPVLNAWAEAGAADANVLPSTGLGLIRSQMGLPDEIPLMPSLEDFFPQDDGLHRTLIVIVRERSIVDRVIQVTQVILGDLNRSNNGILAVLPVLEAYGLRDPGHN